MTNLYAVRPFPGSPASKLRGCLCPVNNPIGYETESLDPVYAVDDRCPIHNGSILRDVKAVTDAADQLGLRVEKG